MPELTPIRWRALGDTAVMAGPTSRRPGRHRGAWVPWAGLDVRMRLVGDVDRRVEPGLLVEDVRNVVADADREAAVADRHLRERLDTFLDGLLARAVLEVLVRSVIPVSM